MDSSTVATIALVFAGITLVLNLGQRIFGGGWNLSKNLTAVETTLKEAIDKTKDEIEERIDATKTEFDARQERVLHNTGESVNALKEHVRLFEFHVRDTYIRKDDFLIHMKQHDDFLTVNFANITQRLERIEKKQDERS
jgi:tetrahydromethanopterin S-methyltransferase subunit G